MQVVFTLDYQLAILAKCGDITHDR